MTDIQAHNLVLLRLDDPLYRSDGHHVVHAARTYHHSINDHRVQR